MLSSFFFFFQVISLMRYIQYVTISGRENTRKGRHRKIYFLWKFNASCHYNEMIQHECFLHSIRAHAWQLCVVGRHGWGGSRWKMCSAQDCLIQVRFHSDMQTYGTSWTKGCDWRWLNRLEWIDFCWRSNQLMMARNAMQASNWLIKRFAQQWKVSWLK